MGSISGGGLNPAVVSALYIANAASNQVCARASHCPAVLTCTYDSCPTQVKHGWIYWVGPCFGAVAAVVLAELIYPVSGGALDHLEDAAAEALAAEEEGESVAAGKEAAGGLVEGVAEGGGGARSLSLRAQ